MRKVLLAYRCSAEGEANPFERILPVGLGYVHAYLRSRGIPSVLANFSAMPRPRILRILLDERPDVVGLSTFTFNRRSTLSLARLVRRTLPAAKIVLGGPHPTHVGAPLLAEHPEVDACVVGEGEVTFERYVRSLEGGSDQAAVRGLVLRTPSGIRATGGAEPVTDLDTLPFPALYPEGHGVDPRTQYPYIVTSRGCPAKCTFCSSPEFWGSRVRFRSAANILEELELLRRRFGILYVSFRDDVFTLNKKRVIDLCRGMIDRRLTLLWDCQTRVNTLDEERLVWMKRAGAMILQLGVESGSQEMLDRMRKGQTVEQIERASALTRRVGLVLSIYLIAGVPGETKTHLRETEALIRRIRPHDGIVAPLAVFPGTSLWEEYRRARDADASLWDQVGHDGLFTRPERFTEEAILRLSTMLERSGRANRYTGKDYAAHREVAGECYATDLMEGEQCEFAGRLAAARRIYERLAAREPWNPWPLLRLGRMALASGDAAAAERLFAEVATQVPEFADARILRARALRALGREDEAGVLLSIPPGSATGAARRKRRRGFQSYPPPRDGGSDAAF